MDSLHHFLVNSVNQNTVLPQHQMDRVSSELSSAIHDVIVNAAALLSFSQSHPTRPDPPPVNATPAAVDSDKEGDGGEEEDQDLEIVELDAVELLAEHIHFCDICGKGFKRDANLRMHMRAHGDQFKTPEALTKPTAGTLEFSGASGKRRKTRFSCPYIGCNRNKQHRNFRPLKSAICVKNHFKRSHCPKMYSCNRCHKKSFSVVADLKSHQKHCGDLSRWKCSCGTTFSRKDKLFGHIALFDGHMPAVAGDGQWFSSSTPASTASVEAELMQFGGFGSSSLPATPSGSFVDDDLSMSMMEEYLNF